MKKRKPVISLTTMPMTKSQLSYLRKWLFENGILLNGVEEFALIAQPSMSRETMDIILINIKTFDKVHKFFVKEGIVRA